MGFQGLGLVGFRVWDSGIRLLELRDEKFRVSVDLGSWHLGCRLEGPLGLYGGVQEFWVALASSPLRSATPKKLKTPKP